MADYEVYRMQRLGKLGKLEEVVLCAFASIKYLKAVFFALESSEGLAPKQWVSELQTYGPQHQILKISIDSRM